MKYSAKKVRWAGGESSQASPGLEGGKQKHTLSEPWVLQGEGERRPEASRPHAVDSTDKMPREAEPENPSGGSSFHQHPVG